METINPPIHQTFQQIFSKNPIAASTWSEDNTPRETSIRHCFWGYYAYVSHKKQKSIKSPSFSTEHCPVPNSIQYALGGMEVNMGNIRETFFANQLSQAQRGVCLRQQSRRYARRRCRPHRPHVFRCSNGKRRWHAGFSPDEIAPLFVEAAEVENISLPDDFWEEIP